MHRYTFLIILLFTGLHSSAQGSRLVSQQLLSGAKTDSAKCQVYRKAVKKYYNVNLDSAMAVAREGMKCFEECKYEPGIAWMLLDMGSIDAEKGYFSFAKVKYELALNIFTETNNLEGIIRTNNSLGAAEGRRGNYVAATKYVVTALTWNEKFGDTGLYGESYLKLGVINEQNNNLEKALEYYYKAMSRFRSVNNLSNIFTLYNNIGIVYAKKGDLATAIQYFESAYRRNTDSARNVETALLSQTNLGFAYSELNKQDSALFHMTRALEIAREIGHKEHYSRTLFGIGNIYAISNPDKALDHYRAALLLVDSFGINPLKLEILSNMSELLEKKGDYKAAFGYLKQANLLNDSLFNSTKTMEIATMQSMHDVQDVRLKMSELQKKERLFTTRFNLVLVVSIALFLLLASLWYAYRRSLRLTRQLSTSEAQLKDASETKDKIFSIIGHDLRGPIRTLSSLIEVYELPSTTEKEKEYIMNALKSQSVAAYETLDKLLFWGLLQIKGVLYNPTIFSPVHNVSANIKLMQSTADQKDIVLKTEVPVGIKVEGDASHFDFIIRNLISNAIKFSPKKSEILIVARENANRPGYVTFSVKDNGMGMDKELVKKIFNKLNSSKAGTDNEKGTGLGLNLSKEFVEKNGGEIWVDSEPGKGTTFFFVMKAAS